MLKKAIVAIALIALVLAGLLTVRPRRARAEIFGNDACDLCMVYNAVAWVYQSVSTPAPHHSYQPNTQEIATADAGLFRQINQQNFSEVFPGWVKLPQNSTDYAAHLTATMLQAYQGAFNAVQQTAQELDAEDFSAQAAQAGNETGLLAEAQDTTVALWEIVNQLRQIRQQLNILTTVEIVEHAEQLNEKSQMAATA